MAREVISIKGLAGLKAALADASSKAHEAAVKAIKEETDATRDDARHRAPVKTGKLRESIRAEAEGLNGEVKATARYAPFVEHGTYRDKAQPYMAPAADKARSRLPKRAAEIIKAALP